MRTGLILASSLGLWVAGADATAASLEGPSTISYRCNDIVVVATVQNVEDSYKHIDIEDDMLGHGWMTAYVKVKRVLHGKKTRPEVYAEYSGHTYLAFAPRKSYLVVLRPANDGTFTAARMRRWNRETKSSLAGACV